LEDFGAGRWLLVIGSMALEMVEFIRQHQCRRNRYGSILFITLTENVAKALMNVVGQQNGIVEFCLPDIDDAVKLLVEHINDDDVDPSKIQEVVKGVGYLPLTIAQVVAFMDGVRITLEEMLAILKSECKLDVCFPLHVPLCSKTDLVTKVVHLENRLLRYQEKSIAFTFLRQCQNLERQFLAATNLLKTVVFLNTECILIELFRMGVAVVAASPWHISAPVDAAVLQQNRSFSHIMTKAS
jgi:hypothetical protein